MIAVVGCGAWGKNLVRNFHALDALSVVVDPSESARARARTIAPSARVFSDVAAALDDPRVSALAIATPATTHAQLCRDGLTRGKDVFCEKPLALRLDEASDVARSAVDGARILMVGHILEYHPGVAALRRIVEVGTLGRLRHVHATRLHPFGEGRDESILWTLAPHDIAVILRLFGRLPRRVVAQGGAWRNGRVPGVATIHLEFDDATAELYVSCVHHFKEQRVVVVGVDATASFDDVQDELLVHRAPFDPRVNHAAPADGRRVEFSAEEPLRLECRAFIDAVRSRRAPLADGRSALDVLRVAAAAEKSLLAEGAPVTP